MMVASMVILRACITLVNISSQMVQVLGFIRLGRTPNARNGAEITPRSGTGRCICSQQPVQNRACCASSIFDQAFVSGQAALSYNRRQVPARRLAIAGKAVKIASNSNETEDHHGRRDAEGRADPGYAFAFGSPLDHGMAEDPLPPLRTPDITVRPFHRPDDGADEVCAGRGAGRP